MHTAIHRVGVWVDAVMTISRRGRVTYQSCAYRPSYVQFTMRREGRESCVSRFGERTTGLKDERLMLDKVERQQRDSGESRGSQRATGKTEGRK